MRHAVFGRKLGRDTNARKALLNNLADAVIERGSVTTTLAKAKFAKPYLEKLVTSAKKSRLGSKRVLASNLPASSFKKLTQEIAPGFKDRSGGYSRIIKLSYRRGDSAHMAKLELLEREKPKEASAKEPKKISAKNTINKVNSRAKKTRGAVKQTPKK